MSLIKSSLLVVSALLSSSLAEESSNPLQNCSSSGGLDFSHYNASGSITVPGMRANITYPAQEQWTWTRYVANLASGNTTGVWQTLGLKTNPIQNLSDPSLLYTGCIVVPSIELLSGSKAQQDDGTCSSVFSADCLNELTENINQNAYNLKGSLFTSLSCVNLIGETVGSKASKCYGQWDGGYLSAGFLPSNFTGPTYPYCANPANPGDSDASNPAFFAWGESLGNALTNFTYYDNAILYPRPVIVATWLKNSSSFPETNPSFISDVRIMCIPANNTTPGSRNITQARESGAVKAGGLELGSLAIVGLSIVFALAL